MNSFAIIGGDERNRALAKYLRAHGCTVCTCALGDFDDFSDSDITSADFEIAVFPHIPTANQNHLFAPLAKDEYILNTALGNVLRGKRIYSGRKSALAASLLLDPGDIIGYDSCESFLKENARLTAEIALMLAIKESPAAIFGSECLVMGVGRIGYFLCKMLRDMGSQVFFCEREQQKCAAAKALGCCELKQTGLCDVEHKFDIIFNTCPELVLDKSVLAGVDANALIIDLASAPGGCDYDECDRLGIKYIKALGLPGKYSPKSAGEIIAQTILNIEKGRV